MDTQLAGGMVIPQPQIPKTFGILNLIFGGLLLLVGLGQAGLVLAAPLLMKMAGQQMQQAQSQAKAAREASIANLKKQAKALQEANSANLKQQTKAAPEASSVNLKQQTKAAPEASSVNLKKQEAAPKSAAEKAQLATVQTELESAPEADFSPFSMAQQAQDVRVTAHQWADISSGLLLNLLFIVSGVGLIGLKEWARKLAAWAAGLKLLRLVASTAVSLLLIIPLQARQSQELFARLNRQQDANAATKPSAGKTAGAANISVATTGPSVTVTAGMQEMAKVGAIMSTVWAVGFLTFASIYPLLSLWFLTRPGARAACLPRTEPDPLGPAGPQ